MDGSLLPAERLELEPEGIVDSAPYPRLTQILIISASVLEEFGLAAGALKENIVVRGLEVNRLPSGTVLGLGDAEVRLTWECEPCSMIRHLVDVKKIQHKRGMLACCLVAGTVQVGDEVSVKDQRFAPIPQARLARVQWYLDQQATPVSAAKLVYDLGLPSSALRQLRRLIDTKSGVDASKLRF